MARITPDYRTTAEKLADARSQIDRDLALAARRYRWAANTTGTLIPVIGLVATVKIGWHLRDIGYADAIWTVFVIAAVIGLVIVGVGISLFDHRILAPRVQAAVAFYRTNPDLFPKDVTGEWLDLLAKEPKRRRVSTPATLADLIGEDGEVAEALVVKAAMLHAGLDPEAFGGTMDWADGLLRSAATTHSREEKARAKRKLGAA